MSIRIQGSRHPAGEVPEITNRGITAAQTFLRGAPIALAVGLASEHAGGATVTGLFGFANEDVTAGLSLGAETTQVNITVANRDTVFMAQLSNTGAVVAPDIGNLDINYGLIEVASEWFVDELDVTNVMVNVVDFDLDLNVVFFKVIESAIEAGS